MTAAGKDPTPWPTMAERLRHDGSLDDEATVSGMDLRYLAEVADEIVRLRAFIADMAASYSLPDHEARGVRWTSEHGVEVAEGDTP